MSTVVLVCGNVFYSISDALTGPAEILIKSNRIARIERSVRRPLGARVVDLSERTMSPGFTDTHVHLTMDAREPRAANAPIFRGQGAQAMCDNWRSGVQHSTIR